MVGVYATLIKNHIRTIDQVPSDLRSAVIERLIADGYDTEGNRLDVS